MGDGQSRSRKSSRRFMELANESSYVWECFQKLFFQ
uniref:Uncharacterized protein n=1 Tax=Utricularia reniformis TaxID=192314 RepID=A0A1Y0B4D3_9LAMI|nr:hypothetical protein AEK19_MT2168 [Utricularia reniformis]ART32316.1 hypothetical protein AEK19_MT2168 [Utricularia reniformis]